MPTQIHSPKRGSTGLDLSVLYRERSIALGRDTATITGTSEMECHSCSTWQIKKIYIQTSKNYITTNLFHRE